MSEDNSNPPKSTRRKTLRLLSASGVGLVGVASSSAAADKTESQQGDEEHTIAEGTSGYVTSDEETPDWFTLKSAGDAKWNIGDFTKKQNHGISPADHLNCAGDQLDWGGSIYYRGIDITLHLDHCAGTCNWEFEIGALGQSYSTGQVRNCDTRETLSFGIHPFNFDVVTRAHNPGGWTDTVDYWTINIEVDYYSIWNGWETKTWSFDIDNPV